MGKGHRNLKVVVSTAFTFVGGLASLLGWLSITPEMVGDAAYAALRVALPFVTFLLGAAFGFLLRTAFFSYRHMLTSEQLDMYNRLSLRGFVSDPGPDDRRVLEQLRAKGLVEHRVDRNGGESYRVFIKDGPEW